MRVVPRSRYRAGTIDQIDGVSPFVAAAGDIRGSAGHRWPEDPNLARPRSPDCRDGFRRDDGRHPGKWPNMAECGRNPLNRAETADSIPKYSHGEGLEGFERCQMPLERKQRERPDSTTTWPYAGRGHQTATGSDPGASEGTGGCFGLIRPATSNSGRLTIPRATALLSP